MKLNSTKVTHEKCLSQLTYISTNPSGQRQAIQYPILDWTEQLKSRHLDNQLSKVTDGYYPFRLVARSEPSGPVQNEDQRAVNPSNYHQYRLQRLNESEQLNCMRFFKSWVSDFFTWHSWKISFLLLRRRRDYLITRWGDAGFGRSRGVIHGGRGV